MPSAPTLHTEASERPMRDRQPRFSWRVLARRTWLRESFILLVFCALTAILSWPYVNYMRDAVVDTGDPYLVSWILWWDYHQTFVDPLNLFHANIFYPFRYTLAFSENCYGIALLFFPLFALGYRPLTVHAVAMFLGFATSGYGAFRLTRTLTKSNGAAWVAGIVFAFVPYRFHVMSQLPYLFSGWVPLLLEALVLFARERTRRRAVWLGCALFFTGLTTISWFTLSLIPFALCAAYFVVRYRLARERDFWRRGAVALGAAAVALMPFMLPYVIVSRMYGFTRSIEEVKANSAMPIHWLSVENRNKLWNRMGEGMTDGARFKLFPGLLPILFSLAALAPVAPTQPRAAHADLSAARRGWLARLDTLIYVAFALSIPAVGFDGTDAFGGFFLHVTSERVLATLAAATFARLCLAYPASLHATHANFVETLRSERRSDAFWLGIILTVIGFCYSLGWNFFFYRILYDIVPLFRSMRVPTRGAMFAYLGLAILAGLGVKRLAELLASRRTRRVRPSVVYAVACVLLLFELNAAPLKLMRGAVYPDGVTLRLKETTMRGGIVVLPAGPDFNHRYMLRAADHARPLIVGTSGFNPYTEDQIEILTRKGPIATELLDFLEKIPTSYVVVENQSIAPERLADYNAFLVRALTAGRLRFIKRFDGHSDLYAVTKTEPEARSEEPQPFDLELREWSQALREDPAAMLDEHEEWSELVYRFYVASDGRPPRFTDFLPDVQRIGRKVMLGYGAPESPLNDNMRAFTDEWVNRPAFKSAFKEMDGERYVTKLLGNAGLLSAEEQSALVNGLNDGTETHASVLLKIAGHEQFARQEHSRALVLLHYFAYLRRNPGEPPDKNMDGFNFWVRDFDESGRRDRLTAAFKDSIEYKARASSHPTGEENKIAP